MSDGEQQAEQENADQEHPEQEAHGGSMAPSLVDDSGHLVAEVPPSGSDVKSS